MLPSSGVNIETPDLWLQELWSDLGPTLLPLRAGGLVGTTPRVYVACSFCGQSILHPWLISSLPRPWWVTAEMTTRLLRNMKLFCALETEIKPCEPKYWGLLPDSFPPRPGLSVVEKGAGLRSVGRISALRISFEYWRAKCPVGVCWQREWGFSSVAYV